MPKPFLPVAPDQFLSRRGIAFTELLNQGFIRRHPGALPRRRGPCLLSGLNSRLRMSRGGTWRSGVGALRMVVRRRMNASNRVFDRYRDRLPGRSARAHRLGRLCL